MELRQLYSNNFMGLSQMRRQCKAQTDLVCVFSFANLVVNLAILVYNRGMRKKTTKIKIEKAIGVLDKNKAGFGFVRQEEGGDIFIGRSNLGGAMHGDTVEVDLLPKYLWVRNKEGIIDKVIERANTEVVGTFQRNKRFGFVVPDDKRNTMYSCENRILEMLKTAIRSSQRLPSIRKKTSVLRVKLQRSFLVLEKAGGRLSL